MPKRRRAHQAPLSESSESDTPVSSSDESDPHGFLTRDEVIRAYTAWLQPSTLVARRVMELEEAPITAFKDVQTIFDAGHELSTTTYLPTLTTKMENATRAATHLKRLLDEDE